MFFIKTMKKTIILLLFLYNIAFSQDANKSFDKYHNKGKSELEFAILGIGFNRIWKKTNFYQGFGISFRYANIILLSNNSGFQQYQKEQQGFINRLGFDYLKLKYIIRKNLINDAGIECSVFSSISFTPEYEGNIFPAYGFEMSIFYLGSKRIGALSSLYITKSFMDSHYYLCLIPVKLIFKLKKNENHIK
jgi:hypothetical protein